MHSFVWLANKMNYFKLCSHSPSQINENENSGLDLQNIDDAISHLKWLREMTLTRNDALLLLNELHKIRITAMERLCDAIKNRSSGWVIYDGRQSNLSRVNSCANDNITAAEKVLSTNTSAYGQNLKPYEWRIKFADFIRELDFTILELQKRLKLSSRHRSLIMQFGNRML